MILKVCIAKNVYHTLLNTELDTDYRVNGCESLTNLTYMYMIYMS